MGYIGRLRTLRAQLRSALYFRQSLLATYLLAVSLTSLIFYLIPPGYYERNANLLTTLLTAAMLPLVRVRTLKSSLGKGLPIIPGMVAQVDIMTGKKTVLSYLLKPVLKAKSYAFSER